MSGKLIEELRANATAHPLDVRLQCMADAADALESQAREIERLKRAAQTNWNEFAEGMKAQPSGVVLPERMTVETAARIGMSESVNRAGAQYACDWYNRALDAVARLNSSPASAGDDAEEAFEEYARPLGFDLTVPRNGDYMAAQTVLAWEGFKAGTAWMARTGSAGGVDERAAIQALRKIMEAHRFNVAGMAVTEVHAICFDALTASAPNHGEQVREARQVPSAQLPSQGGEAVAYAAGDRLLLSAESKARIFDRERMVYRPDEHGRPPEQTDPVFAWAFIYGGMREFCCPSEVMDQVRLGLFFGDGDAGPNPGYTDWIPLYTHPADQVAEGGQHARDSEELRSLCAARDQYRDLSIKYGDKLSEALQLLTQCQVHLDPHRDAALWSDVCAALGPKP